jgi:hypothetical protein
MKCFLQILTIVLGFFSLAVLYDLLQPIKENTWAVNKELEFTESHTEEFYTDFHAPYKYLLEVKREKGSLKDSQVRVFFTNDRAIIVDTILNSQRYFLSVNGSFNAEEGDHYVLKVIDQIDKTSSKKLRILVDVNSGGPSVGIAFTKAFRPYLWGVFVFLVLSTLVSSYIGFVR